MCPIMEDLLTTNEKRKHGQPFPALMDYDGDGKLTLAEEIIRTTLSHNPDSHGSSEGVALVAVAILTAV